MKDRIKQIMENENLAPAKFADRLQINRAIISHILNGRNNPSLDVVSKILLEMPYINPEWLINGSGEIYKEGFDIDSIPKEHDLFSLGTEIPTHETENPQKTQETEVNHPVFPTQIGENKGIIMQKSCDKKISQIIIYYNDNTFETFIPHAVK